MHPVTLERFVGFVPDAQRTFESLTLSAWLYQFCQVGDAVMISAASLVVLGSGILPRWLALVGFPAAIPALLHFLIPLIGAVSGLVWVALVSALMLGGFSQGASTPPPPCTTLTATPPATPPATLTATRPRMLRYVS